MASFKQFKMTPSEIIAAIERHEMNVGPVRDNHGRVTGWYASGELVNVAGLDIEEAVEKAEEELKKHE